MKLSLTGGSGMSIRTLFECPRKFKHILEGYRRKYVPLYFVKGTIFHREAEKIIVGSGIRGLAEVQKIIDNLKEGKYWDEKKEEWREFEPEKVATGRKKKTEIEQFEEQLPQMLYQVYANKSRFDGNTGIERYVETAELINPEGIETDDQKLITDSGIVFCGTVDVDKPQRVEDIKTAAPSTVKALSDEEREQIQSGGWLDNNGTFQPTSDLQLHLYAYLKTITDGKPVQSIGFHVFTKHVGRCDYIPIQAEMKPKYFCNVFDMCIDAGKTYLECEKRGYPQWGYRCGCKDKYMQKCEFECLCFPERYSSPDPESNGIIKKEKENAEL